MNDITQKNIRSILYIRDPFTGNIMENTEGRKYKVSTEDEKLFFRVMVESRDREPIKLFFDGENSYNRWRNTRKKFKQLHPLTV